MMDGHRWFARFYDRMMAEGEKRVFGEMRREMLKDVTGRVLEIGAGTGANFPHYQPGARVTATEPDPYMFQRARKRAAEAAVQIELQQAWAEDMPFPDGTFDFAIDTLVLCSVRDPRRVLAEIGRVLKPGGELRLYEHVRYRNALGGLAQDIATPVWKWVGAGCHPNRNIEDVLLTSGLEVIDLRRRMEFPPVLPFCISRPQLQAVARRPEVP